MAIEYAIFLGAGASKADGAPLQGELFREYFFSSFTATNENELTLRNTLKDFFNSYFGINVDTSNDTTEFPTYEEVLGILELAIRRKECFNDTNLRNPTSDEIRQKLILMIAMILDIKLKGQNKYHKMLVRNMINSNLIYKTSFVSLNYDILIDNALADVNQHHDLDYGLEFTNFEKEDDWHRPDPSKAVKLYKLHGSLNWLYCPTCISLTLTPQVKGVREFVYEPKKCKCPSCRNMTIPIIIPPTFFKVMSNYFLQQVWHSLEQELRNIKKLIFCGYSFPDADIHVKYLLKRIELCGNDGFEIIIVNHFNGKMKHEIDIEKNRYLRFFKDFPNVEYTNMSFEMFCENGYEKCIK